jgi:hypothetical protein
MPVTAAVTYNNIRESIAGRVGNQSVWSEYGSLTTPLTTISGYGRNFISDTVVGGSTPGVSDTITEQQHFDLWLDVQAGYVHQNGSLSGTSDPTDFEGKRTYPSDSDIGLRDPIEEQHLDDVNTVATAVLGFNHTTTDFPASSFDGPNPLETSGGASTASSRSSSWGGSGDSVTVITHEVTVNFASHNDLLYYLAAGGEIRFNGSATGGTTGTQYSKDWDWAQIFTDIGTVRFGRVNNTTWRCESIGGTGTGYSNSSIGSGSTWTKIFEKQGGGRAGGNPGVIPVAQIYDDNFLRIYARTNSAFSSATALQFKIELDDGDTGTGGQAADGFIGPKVDESVTATVNSTVYTYTPSSSFTYDSVTYNAIALPVPTGTKDSDF